MDFISSISFPNEQLNLGHFGNHFWVGATAKVMTKMIKKCSTDQRFIRKRNTTYEIGTLVCEVLPDINSPSGLGAKSKSSVSTSKLVEIFVAS